MKRYQAWATELYHDSGRGRRVTYIRAAQTLLTRTTEFICQRITKLSPVLSARTPRRVNGLVVYTRE